MKWSMRLFLFFISFLFGYVSNGGFDGRILRQVFSHIRVGREARESPQKELSRALLHQDNGGHVPHQTRYCFVPTGGQKPVVCSLKKVR